MVRAGTLPAPAAAEECRDLLAAKSVERVAFNGPDGPQVLPVNYVVHRRSIFFRTAAGSMLADAMRNSRVAFEIDDIDEFLQSGVLVRNLSAAATLSSGLCDGSERRSARRWLC